MKIAFAGFRHGHIFGLFNAAKEDSRVTITGCFEEDAAARENAAKTVGAEFSYNSYSELLSDPNVEVVAIGDYFSKRGQLAIEALKSGKHVICDKPICTDLAELDEIERLSAEENLKVGCMLDLRYMPQTVKAKELIENGAIGDLHIASYTGQHCLDYGNRPAWYFEEGKQGGTINDIAIHGLDLLRLITGKNLTKINCAKTWNAFADKEPNFKDCGQFMIEMDNIAVMADVSYAAPKFSGTMPTYWDFKFWGSKGMLQFNLLDNNIYIYKEELEVIDCGEKSPEIINDFIGELGGEQTLLSQGDIFMSQRQILTIQKKADEM